MLQAKIRHQIRTGQADFFVGLDFLVGSGGGRAVLNKTGWRGWSESLCVRASVRVHPHADCQRTGEPCQRSSPSEQISDTVMGAQGRDYTSEEVLCFSSCAVIFRTRTEFTHSRDRDRKFE